MNQHKEVIVYIHIKEKSPRPGTVNLFHTLLNLSAYPAIKEISCLCNCIGGQTIGYIYKLGQGASLLGPLW